jgi:hypothetical protein
MDLVRTEKKRENRENNIDEKRKVPVDIRIDSDRNNMVGPKNKKYVLLPFQSYKLWLKSNCFKLNQLYIYRKSSNIFNPRQNYYENINNLVLQISVALFSKGWDVYSII